VSITNRSGKVVHSGSTPLTVTLKKGAGYFKPENYVLRFTKDGYQPRELNIRGSVSGWYFGNILFGGLIGMLAVDPATGAMFKLQPESIDAALEAMSVAQTPEAGTLTVVMTPDLPAEILERATPLTAN
jgi:hypothetical protein